MVVLRAALLRGVVSSGVCFLFAGASACAAPPPGFLLVDATAVAPGTPRVLTTAIVDAAHATLTLTLKDVGPAFGVSVHVLLANTVQVDDIAVLPVLGDANEVIPVRSTNGIDVSVGAVRRDGVERALADGPFAIVTVTAQDPAPVHLVVERALVRRSDGSFVPLAAQSGVLTLEAP